MYMHVDNDGQKTGETRLVVVEETLMSHNGDAKVSTIGSTTGTLAR
jgi:hypothetical protein